MAENVIDYEDPEAPEHLRTRQTSPMRSVASVTRRSDLRDLADRLSKNAPEPQPKVCPYGECENTYDRIKGEWIPRPIGFITLKESGRVTQCRCLLDRIEKAKPVENSKPATPGKLFTREPIVDDPESEEL